MCNEGGWWKRNEEKEERGRKGRYGKERGDELGVRVESCGWKLRLK